MANKIGCSTQKILCISLILLTFGMGILFYKTRFYKSYTFVAIDKYSSQQTRDSSSTSNKSYTIKNNVTKWIVVTTIKYPSKDIEKLTKIKGWQLLVVGDLKTPSNWTYPGCIFLGIDQQRQLGFRIAEHLPTNSYTRKIIGYLYAIQNGAKYIYDTDDDNHPSDGRINFQQEEITSGLIYADHTSHVMNPYAHFGQPSIWPRGFPLDMVDKPSNHTYKLCTFKTPAIQQGLVNGDPDVDAIFRLTRKAPNQRYINVTFDAAAPPVTLPVGVFAPFNSQNTFFTYDAFWALFLPTSVAFRVTDIWRGYWAQRLLWLIGQRLSFFPPNAVQFRNSHDYLDDFKDESQFYLQTDSLVEFLKKWTCSEKTFFECVSHLGHKMAELAFWNTSDAELLESWLSDLTSVGYRQPKMTTGISDCDSSSTTVYYSSEMTSSSARLLSLGEFCGHNCFNVAEKSQSEPQVLNLLLVVVFNSPHYGSIPLLDTLYGDHFSSVVYCGSTAMDHLTLRKQVRLKTSNSDEWDVKFPWQERRVPFIATGPNTADRVGYECAIYAMQMNYGVDGFLVVGDKVLLNFWNLRHDFNFSHPHMQLSEHRVVDSRGWAGASSAMDELKVLAKGHPNQRSKALMSDFFRTRAQAGFNESQILLGFGDLYYVPKSVADTFVGIAKVFAKHQVSLEIAVPTAIAGLVPVASSEGFTGKNVVPGGAVIESLTHFDSSLHYLQPVNLSSISGDGGQKFCETYAESWFKNW